MKKEPKNKKKISVEDKKFPLPIYSADEDIYKKEKEVPFEEEKRIGINKKLSADLDVPGSELDDAGEEIGEEDEENNYYSLGGDNHIDLEEDKAADR